MKVGPRCGLFLQPLWAPEHCPARGLCSAKCLSSCQPVQQSLAAGKKLAHFPPEEHAQSEQTWRISGRQLGWTPLPFPKQLTAYCQSVTSLLSQMPRGPEASVRQDSVSLPTSVQPPVPHLLCSEIYIFMLSLKYCLAVFFSPLVSNLSLFNYTVKMCSGYICFLFRETVSS